MIALLLAAASAAIWLYLLLGRGFFWLGKESDYNLLPGRDGAGDHLPAIIAIVPARDEAEVIARSIGSLLRQDYPGRLSIVLIDDQSSDRTAELARGAARAVGAGERLTVLRGSDPPAGWTGKLWAMDRGFLHVQMEPEPPEFVLFTDADIAYEASDAVERLVRGARAQDTVLTSLMVKLRCESLAERVLVPAFIFFFAKLYPFAWVNNPRRRTGAAAGGCMLVRREALEAAGGLAPIRGALIDDCALAKLLQHQGPIWLGLTRRVTSLRPYPEFSDIRRMVARSAYAELRYSPLRLGGTLLGMALTYVAPPLLAILADGPAQLVGVATWIAMALAFQPTLRFYRRSPLWGLALPLIAALYTAFTVESALQHRRGRGGAWKGRFQASASAERIADA
jgi:hopene-associated glycosyltransferase HpnB